MKDYRLYVFDMDGVLFRGDEVTPGGPETINDIHKSGALIRYLTNNSTKTRREYAEKLYEMGYPAEPAQIYTSAIGAAIYLGKNSAYVIGEDGLRAELRSAGCNVTDGDADWVVVGACWSLTYTMIDEAQWRIRQGARFLATNTDATYPIEGGRVRPGAGACVAAVATAAEREPEIVIGKPHTTLLQMIWSETEASPADTLLVGDRLDTDIACALNAGCDSALVLTGASTDRDLKSTNLKPTYIYGSVADL
ncbi:MAG: HAD-IIA family hydrolase [Fimbriimonadales bacterium]